jgi:hypothetical protein
LAGRLGRGLVSNPYTSTLSVCFSSQLRFRLPFRRLESAFSDGKN